MADRYFKQFINTLEAGVVKLYGQVTLGAAGAIATSNCKGFSITKTGGEAGRYTVALEDKYTGLLAASVILEGAADTLYTTATGLTPLLRGVSVGTNKVLYIQFVDRATAPADANPETGAKFYIELTLKNSSAF